MQSALPLEILADELGAAAGRIERELRLKDEARAARFEARLAAIELAAFKAEEERQRIFGERLAELRNGRDGEPGRDGKDADISHLEAEFRRHEDDWENRICERIDSVKDGLDGKDGEPGKDGEDADIEPLIERIHVVEELSVQHIELLSEELTDKVDAKLAEVKDGKDGEPGKDADIGPIVDTLEAKFRNLSNLVDLDLDKIEEKVDARLAEVRDGEQGPAGKDGKDGKLPIVREWTNRVHYEGDVVRHAGSTYQALTDTGQQPPHSDWGELASRGTDGRGFVLRGTYDASAGYRQHDIVMINRNSFAAKYDNPGECPGEGWQLFGPSGQRGKEGPPGSPGAKGADGRSVSIVKWEADPDEMVLRIADSAGNTFAVDLQPIAERILEAAR